MSLPPARSTWFEPKVSSRKYGRGQEEMKLYLIVFTYLNGARQLVELIFQFNHTYSKINNSCVYVSCYVVCVRVCACVRACVRERVCACVGVSVSPYMSEYVCGCVDVCACVRVCACVGVSVSPYMSVWVCARVRVRSGCVR